MKILQSREEMLALIREQRKFEADLAKHLCDEKPGLGYAQALAMAEKATRPKE